MSAVICTLDRAEYLHAALVSLLAQYADPALFEIIVVDNGPGEATRRVVENLNPSQPPIRYLVESRKGLSIARQTGWRAAVGDVVAFLDDDAIADPSWIDGVAAAFSPNKGDVAWAAGPVDPILEEELPPWYPLAWQGALDLGSDNRPLLPNEYAWGCNMAFRRDRLAEVTAFSENLGRTGTNLMANEDVIVQKRLAVLGHVGWYEPLMRIQHHHPTARTTKQWMRRRAYWQGVSDSVMDSYLGEPRLKPLVHSCYASSRRCLSLALYAFKERSEDGPRRSLENEMAILHTVGYGAGIIRSLGRGR